MQGTGSASRTRWKNKSCKEKRASNMRGGLYACLILRWDVPTSLMEDERHIWEEPIFVCFERLVSAQTKLILQYRDLQHPGGSAGLFVNAKVTYVPCHVSFSNVGSPCYRPREAWLVCVYGFGVDDHTPTHRVLWKYDPRSLLDIIAGASQGVQRKELVRKI